VRSNNSRGKSAAYFAKSCGNRSGRTAGPASQIDAQRSSNRWLGASATAESSQESGVKDLDLRRWRRFAAGHLEWGEWMGGRGELPARCRGEKCSSWALGQPEMVGKLRG
jgi:hypothetical protein